MAWTDSNEPFSKGVEAGVARAGDHGLVSRAWPQLASREFTNFRDFWGVYEVREVLERTLESTRGLLGRTDASDRFSELFAEMLTVAMGRASFSSA
jgi:hypothetical protein